MPVLRKHIQQPLVVDRLQATSTQGHPLLAGAPTSQVSSQQCRRRMFHTADWLGMGVETETGILSLPLLRVLSRCQAPPPLIYGMLARVRLLSQAPPLFSPRPPPLPRFLSFFASIPTTSGWNERRQHLYVLLSFDVFFHAFMRQNVSKFIKFS